MSAFKKATRKIAGTHCFTIRVPNDLYSQIATLASLDDRSMNGYICRIISEHLAEHFGDIAGSQNTSTPFTSRRPKTARYSKDNPSKTIEKGFHVYPVRLPSDQYTMLGQLASDDERSMNTYITRLFRKTVEKNQDLLSKTRVTSSILDDPRWWGKTKKAKK